MREVQRSSACAGHVLACRRHTVSSVPWAVGSCTQHVTCVHWVTIGTAALGCSKRSWTVWWLGAVIEVVAGGGAVVAATCFVLQCSPWCACSRLLQTCITLSATLPGVCAWCQACNGLSYVELHGVPYAVTGAVHRDWRLLLPDLIADEPVTTTCCCVLRLAVLSCQCTSTSHACGHPAGQAGVGDGGRGAGFKHRARAALPHRHQGN